MPSAKDENPGNQAGIHTLPEPSKESRIGIVVQARMGSSRLRGKVLMRIQNRTLLEYLVEGCRTVKDSLVLCVATSTEGPDDAIAQHCAEIGVECYRGPLEDVAGRYLGAASAYNLHAVVRISADSPLIPPSIVAELICRYREAAGCDLATNVLRRTYLSGMSVEVIRTLALAGAYPLMTAEEREHVTPYFYAHRDDFCIVSVERSAPLEGGKLSVDTAGDFALIKALIERLQKAHSDYSVEELAELSLLPP